MVRLGRGKALPVVGHLRQMLVAGRYKILALWFAWQNLGALLVGCLMISPGAAKKEGEG